MSYWNPEKLKILYFHVVRDQDDYYLKINTEQKRVWKLNLSRLRIQGKYYNVGIYELNWSTFLSGYQYRLKPDWIEYGKYLTKKDGNVRTIIKHTTENQITESLRKLLIEITKI